MYEFETAIGLMKEGEEQFFKDLGSRVCARRTEQGMTQAQLADMLGVTQQVVASYEVGRRRVPASMLPALSKCLGATIEDLLGMGNGRKKPGPVPKLNRQLERISMLPKEQQKSIMQVLDMALKSAL